MSGPPLRRQRASPVPEVWEVAAFGGSCIWWLMLLGDRGLSWVSGAENQLELLRAACASSQDANHGVGRHITLWAWRPTSEGCRRLGGAPFTDKRRGLLFPSPGSPRVYLWSNSAACHNHRPPPQLQGKGHKASSRGDRARSAEKSIWVGVALWSSLGGSSRCCGALV